MQVRLPLELVGFVDLKKVGKVITLAHLSCFGGKDPKGVEVAFDLA